MIKTRTLSYFQTKIITFIIYIQKGNIPLYAYREERVIETNNLNNTPNVREVIRCLESFARSIYAQMCFQ